MDKKIKIVHIITSLGSGGAERVMAQLLQHMDRNRFEHVLIVLKNDNRFYPIPPWIKLYCLDMHKNLGCLVQVVKIYKIIKFERPDILKTWLYHADFLGFIIGKILGIKKIYWSVHSTKLFITRNSKITIFIRKICAIFSKYVTGVIACSHASLQEHIRVGYKASKLIYIPNGYDNKLFYNDIHLSLRREFNLSSQDVVIGMVARFHLEKDHRTFLRSLDVVRRQFPTIKALLVGKNVDSKNKCLSRLIMQYGLSNNVYLLGERTDIINIYNTIDFLVLSSKSESFPNTVAEAMLCNKPCIATDVGDVVQIIGDTGYVVLSSNPQLLAGAIIKMLTLSEEERNIMGKKAQQRIIDNYALDKIISRYENVYYQDTNLVCES